MRSGGDRVADLVPGGKDGGYYKRRFRDLLDHYDDIVARENNLQERHSSILDN